MDDTTCFARKNSLSPSRVASIKSIRYTPRNLPYSLGELRRVAINSLEKLLSFTTVRRDSRAYQKKVDKPLPLAIGYD